jgi:hypothetical protein
MTTFAFPSVVAALVVALKVANATTLVGVIIYDGISLSLGTDNDAIAIGHDGTEDGSVAAGNDTFSWDFQSPIGFMEQGSIDCVLWSKDGTTDLAARRTAAFANLSAVATVIKTDATLAGTCLNAFIDTASSVYEQTPDGCQAVINFTVSYRAII